MYDFIRGPLVWTVFLIFFAGCIYKLVRLVRRAKDDKVVLPYMTWKHSLRSIAHWVVPFGARNMRLRPVMTVATFAFHLCLLVTPLFLMAHNVLWFESWGLSLPSLPERVADVMTLVVIAAGVFFLARRIYVPVVAYVTDVSDYLILLVAIAPFITGFMATQGWFHYDTMLILHILSGALWLVAIPFTRLSHMIYFAFTRAYMGCEFGAVRNARDW
ncbi:TmcC family electron transfer complex membrane anchor subunit [Planctomycetota bacterium]